METNLNVIHGGVDSEDVYILGWPESSFGYFHKMLGENLNEPLGHPNVYDGILLGH